MDDSRPDPGPFTRTSTERIPWSLAAWPAICAALCAANGVPFLEPLNPWPPEDAQETTSPEGSLMVMMVLLNVARMWQIP